MRTVEIILGLLADFIGIWAWFLARIAAKADRRTPSVSMPSGDWTESRILSRYEQEMSEYLETRQ